jgi:hypothetical protein
MNSLRLKRCLLEVGGYAVDEHLLDERQALQRFMAAGVGVRRDLAPAGHLKPLAFQLHQQSALCLRRARRPGVKEYEACRKHRSKFDRRRLRESAQKFRRLLQEQSAAVAGLAVACDRAPVGEAIQRSNCRLDQPMARLVIQLGDQPKAAAILFIGVAEQPAVGGTHTRPRRLTWLVSVLHRSAGGSIALRPPEKNCSTSGFVIALLELLLQHSRRAAREPKPLIRGG